VSPRKRRYANNTASRQTASYRISRKQKPGGASPHGVFLMKSRARSKPGPHEQASFNASPASRRRNFSIAPKNLSEFLKNPGEFLEALPYLTAGTLEGMHPRTRAARLGNNTKQPRGRAQGSWRAPWR
jgi:hypothetical protein